MLGGNRKSGVARLEIPTGRNPKRRCLIAKESKFTNEQRYRIVLDLMDSNIGHAEVCRKYGISSTYAYKLKDRALDILRKAIGRPAGKPDVETEKLQKRVADLEQLAGDQALAIRYLKKTDAR